MTTEFNSLEQDLYREEQNNDENKNNEGRVEFKRLAQEPDTEHVTEVCQSLTTKFGKYSWRYSWKGKS